jgi:AmmeMemoRadiSam system protein B
LYIVVDVAIIFFLFCDFSKRVFLLGPSHHYYTPKCALSTATVYKTPIGDLPIDLEGSVNRIKYE